VEPPGVRDHAWGQVNAADLDAETGEMGRDRSWAAADVEHRPKGGDALGERRQRGTQPRRWRELADAHRDVVVGDPVIGRPDDFEISGLHHVSKHREKG